MNFQNSNWTFYDTYPFIMAHNYTCDHLTWITHKDTCNLESWQYACYVDMFLLMAACTITVWNVKQSLEWTILQLQLLKKQVTPYWYLCIYTFHGKTTIYQLKTSHMSNCNANLSFYWSKQQHISLAYCISIVSFVFWRKIFSCRKLAGEH